MENTFFDTISYKMNGIGNGMYDLFLNLRDSFNDTVDKVSEKLSIFWQNLKVWSKEGLEVFIEGMQKLGSSLAEFGHKLASLSSEAFGKLKEFSKEAFDKIKEFSIVVKDKIKQGIEYIGEKLPVLGSKLKKEITVFANKTKIFLSDLGSKIKDVCHIVSEKCSNMKDSLIKGANSLKSKLKEKWPKVASKIKEISSKTKVKVAAGLVALGSGAKTLANTMKEKFAEAKHSLSEKFLNYKSVRAQKKANKKLSNPFASLENILKKGSLSVGRLYKGIDTIEKSSKKMLKTTNKKLKNIQKSANSLSSKINSQKDEYDSLLCEIGINTYSCAPSRLSYVRTSLNKENIDEQNSIYKYTKPNTLNDMEEIMNNMLDKQQQLKEFRDEFNNLFDSINNFDFITK